MAVTMMIIINLYTLSFGFECAITVNIGALILT
jgi:hypothetical protein